MPEQTSGKFPEGHSDEPLSFSRGGSLADYAEVRGRLAGSKLLELNDPWFWDIDKLRDDLAARGLPLLSFSHYDYLGISDDPRVRSASESALKTYGTTVSASRLVGGERGIHAELERAIATFVGAEAALVLVSGYLTNATVIGHLLGAKDVIVYDQFCHNSILHGIAASKAHAIAFPHNDMDALDRILRDVRKSHARCLIVGEGLYSMDGDIIDLPKVVELKHRHQCWLMIDDAHSIGVLGTTGRGVAEHFGIDPREIDLLIGTLSKSLVSTGGFVAGAAAVIRLLKYTLPGLVYSVGIPPVSAAAALEALRILAAEPWRVARSQALSELFVAEARRRNLDTGPAAGRAVIPILLNHTEQVIHLSATLAEDGIYVPPIVRIGVPKDKPRLRFFVSVRHTEQDIARVLDAVAACLANDSPQRALAAR